MLSEKLTAKRAIDRFRYKVTTVMESPTSSMVPRVSKSMNGARGESPFIRGKNCFRQLIILITHGALPGNCLTPLH